MQARFWHDVPGCAHLIEQSLDVSLETLPISALLMSCITHGKGMYLLTYDAGRKKDSRKIELAAAWL